MEKANEEKHEIRHGNVNTAVSISALPSIQEVQYLMPESVNAVFRQEKPPDDRPFLCNICGNRFRQQCHLTQHIRIHTNDRPYHCSHCEKAFKQKSQLNQHERIHTGEKPYQCPLCEKAFPQAGQLYSHKKTHGINPSVTKRQPYSEQIGIPKRGRKRKVKTSADSSNSPVVLSPPPVAYLIESFHRSPPPQYEHSRSNKLPSTSTLISSADGVKVQHLMTKEGTIYTIPSTSTSAEHKFIPPTTSAREHHYLQSQIYYQQLQQQQQYMQQHIQQQQQHHHHQQQQQHHQQQQHQQQQEQEQQQQQQQKQQQQQQQQQQRTQEVTRESVKQEPVSPQIPRSEMSMPIRTSQDNPVVSTMANHTFSSVGKLVNRVNSANTVPSHLKDLERLIPTCDTT